jgi:hypothetical protein
MDGDLSKVKKEYTVCPMSLRHEMFILFELKLKQPIAEPGRNLLTWMPEGGNDS